MSNPTEPALDPGRRRDALRNEAQIVAAATRLLAEHPEATMQEVADAAGLGRATVYRHFPTRETLWAAIERAAMDEVAAVLADRRLEEGDPIEALGRAVEGLFAISDRYRVLAAEGRHGPSPGKAARAESAFLPMAALLDRARRSGALAADVPLEWAYAAVGAVIGTAVRQVAAGALAREDAPAMVMRAILHGFGAPPAGGR